MRLEILGACLSLLPSTTCSPHTHTDERVDTVASGALDGELLVDESRQFSICLYALRQGHDTIHNVLVRLLK
jgi:hypothetical protein